MIPVLIKTFQEPLESTGLISVLRVFYQVEFRAFLAVLVAFGAGMQTVLGTVALFAGIRFIEGNLIQPLLQKRMTRLPPALTILSQTLLGTLFGIGGVILATPVLAVTLVAVRMLYVEDVLGDRAAADE